MDVFISDEYVARRRAERRAARNAAAARGEKAPRGDNGYKKRWTAAWAEQRKRAGDGNASAAWPVEDVIFGYFSA